MKVFINNQQKVKIDTVVLKDRAREALKSLRCNEHAELSILLTDNDGIQELNKRYLQRNRPTDILSFPMGNFSSELRTPNSELILGDVVISVEMAKAQAKQYGVPVDEEITRLLIHGILHLFGFDHERGGKEALNMVKEEERLLKIVKCKW